MINIPGAELPPEPRDLKLALRRFNEIITGEVWNKEPVYVLDILKVIGKDASALDPSGNSSAAKMEAELNAAIKTNDLAKAKQFLNYVREGNEHALFHAHYIPELLNKHKVGIGELDSSKPAAVVQAELDNGLKTAHLRRG